MARIYHTNRPTRELILRTGMRLFLEKGYTKTHCSSITKELGISPGNLTFYFSTKEHLLAELVEYLCRYQWLTMEAANEDGKSPLYSYCMELASMAALSSVTAFFLCTKKMIRTVEVKIARPLMQNASRINFSKSIPATLAPTI